MNKATLVTKIEEKLKAQNTEFSEGDLGNSLAIIVDNNLVFTVFDDSFILSVDPQEIDRFRERDEVVTITNDLVPSNTDLSVNIDDQNVDELIDFWVPKAVLKK